MSLKTFIIVLVVFYGLIAVVTAVLRINHGAWSEAGRFIITKWFLIPIFSFLSGVIGSILLKSIWPAAVINFICCLAVMTLLYLNVSYADSTILDWIKYSVVIFIITILSSSITYFFRRAYIS